MIFKIETPRLSHLAIAILLATTGYFVGSERSAGPQGNVFKVRADSDVGSAIHDYLLQHPEVLPEMSAALQQKQRAAFTEHAQQAIGENRAAIYSDPADGTAGNPNGHVTVVEFFDYQCPYCKQVGPDLARLLTANPEVRIIYKEFPILGGGSVAAARAALASVRQGKYAALHAALLGDKTPEHQLDETHILEVAKSVGLDVGRLNADMASPEIVAKVDANLALGRNLGINGTPDLIVNDQVIQGMLPYDQLSRLVADRAVAALASGERH